MAAAPGPLTRTRGRLPVTCDVQGRSSSPAAGTGRAAPGDEGASLTLQRLPVHHPLHSGLGVPAGSAHQPPVLARGQDEVLGFVQPVGGSWKTRTAQAGGQAAQGRPKREQMDLLWEDVRPEGQPQALSTSSREAQPSLPLASFTPQTPTFNFAGQEL